jgi:hypothetical protein
VNTTYSALKERLDEALAGFDFINQYDIIGQKLSGTLDGFWLGIIAQLLGFDFEKDEYLAEKLCDMTICEEVDQEGLKRWLKEGKP